MQNSMYGALGVGALAALATAGLMVGFGPRQITLATEHTGDAQLATDLERLAEAEPGYHTLSALVYDQGEVTFGGLGADEHTEFEIGSITKTFNAELVRQLIDEDVLTLDTTVGDILGESGAPIDTVTLEELLSHTAGLEPMGPLGFGDILWANLTEGGNAYRNDSPEDILAAAPEMELEGRGEDGYSNYGHALLGQLLSRTTDTPYEELVRTRILEPAGMDDTYVAGPGGVDKQQLGRGLASNGRAAEPWDMDGWAPAGAIRSTAADMAQYIEWVDEHGRPDYGWATLDEYTFHNGGTGGFRTMLVWDPKDPHRAVYVAGDTEAWVDELGIDLLKEEE
ncbi:serine hydrolase [Corynebacterium sp. HMSC071B10]|uniref:serine hydrolase domain-containing protein n=1 Tax=Corynebacterium sp. HMSC071B10 TaxID=1739494 RepID=UPI000A8C9F14|nr:serine hydrolase domain-containing protein [Corynebacterium sp. HMSC071B10]